LDHVLARIKAPALLTARRRVLQGAAVAAASVAAGALGAPGVILADGDQEDATILEFSTMAGIQKPFLGDAGLGAFRGVHGGGAPWVLSRAHGSLTADGQLEVEVEGLVLDPRFVPPPNGGTNPIPFFMAIVSGFSTDPVNPVNLSTGLFPASKAGDAEITATLSLPHPFYAPIIFVTSLPIGTPPNPRWFAVTGIQ
jgi:hypothetical protein